MRIGLSCERGNLTDMVETNGAKAPGSDNLSFFMMQIYCNPDPKDSCLR